MSTHALEALLIEELNDLFDAEKKITKALPKMVKAAESEELSAAFEEHLQQTEQHIARLEEIFELLGTKPGRKKCEAIEGLLEEGKEMMEDDHEAAVKDAGLIAAAQRVEHYEMAGYGCARTWARVLGNSQVADLLQLTLDEEGETDKKLTQIAESLNVEARDQSDSGDESMDDNGNGAPRRATSTRARRAARSRAR